MIYVVLGMHKSGTTLVSQMLHHSGINMGEFDEDVSYDKGNKYERESTLQLDMDILGAEDYEVLDLTPQGAMTLSDGQRDSMREIIVECSEAHDNWGFKDPRAALIYQLWAEELPVHKLIVVYRHPCQSWPRFKWLGKRKYHTNFNRAYSYLHRWQEHNRSILGYLAKTKVDYVVINYEELMSSDLEFQRLNDFVEGGIGDRRKGGLFRGKSGTDIFLLFADKLMLWRKGISIEKTLHELGSMR